MTNTDISLRVFRCREIESHCSRLLYPDTGHIFSVIGMIFEARREIQTKVDVRELYAIHSTSYGTTVGISHSGGFLLGDGTERSLREEIGTFAQIF